MAVSKHRKNHKKKSKQRTEQMKIAQRKQKQYMLEQYLETQRRMMENQAPKTQKSGELVENTDIELDLGVDLDNDELFIQDDFSIIEEELEEEAKEDEK